MSLIDLIVLIPFYIELCFKYSYVLLPLPTRVFSQTLGQWTRPRTDTLSLTRLRSLTPSNRGLLTLRALRLLRVLSFLRLERSYNALKNLRTILAKKKEELGLVTYMTAVIVLTSSITMYESAYAMPFRTTAVGLTDS